MRLFSITLLLLIATASIGKQRAKPSSCTTAEGAIDGVYKFVSEATQLTQPSPQRIERQQPDWDGIWQFHAGYYSAIMTKAGRESLLASSTELGALAYAGRFGIRGDELILYQNYAISPLEVNRPRTLQYKVQGDLLLLTQQLHPYVEDMREGNIVTTLKRLE